MILDIQPHDPQRVSRFLDRVLRVLEEKLPRIIQDDLRRLRSAANQGELIQAERNLRNSVLDWTRAKDRTFHTGIGTSYCECILCGGSVASRAGIEKHLSRYGDCPVFSAILYQVHQAYAQTASRAEEEALERQAQQELASDRYLVNLANGPEINRYLFDPRRAGTQIEFAERRLADLGFIKIVDRERGFTVTRWERQVEGVYLLADPRSSGSIKFRAWDLETVERRTKGKKVYETECYTLYDHWRNDLGMKIMKKAEESLGLQDGALRAYYAQSKPQARETSRSTTTEGRSDPKALIDLPPDNPAEVQQDTTSEDFLNLPHSEVLRQARSMSRKALLERYRLSPASVSRRIKAAIDWEKGKSPD